MKHAYFHCFAGASGDMLLGSLIDAGCDPEKIISQLTKLPVKGWTISAQKSMKNSISGTRLNISIEEQHSHRNLETITDIIKKGKLSQWVTDNAIAVFTKLAEVEAQIHGTTTDKIHFHEIGAIDSILDITGFIIALEIMNIKKISASPVHLGTGFTQSMHGKIPVPSPATMSLLKDVPVYSEGIKGELTTPTGAVLLKHFVSSFGSMPSLKIETTGYGCGTKDREIPNMLRVIIGEDDSSEKNFLEDSILLIETTIDDMNPEHIGFLQKKIFEAGALDMWITPVYMKKNRPGNLISILTEIKKETVILDTLFINSTTSGVRLTSQRRKKLHREIKSVETAYGMVEVKVHYLHEKIITVSPEYESCRLAAEKHNASLKSVYEAAIEAFYNN